ncbi:MAG: transglycosylase SLT domain-containing protein [Bacteriovorax sp.]|nr:transglycosylase SLT domain-containing protein [Bacteriovorax sp.]
MKNITTNFTSRSDKELFCKIILFSTLAIGVCSIDKNKSSKIRSIKISHVYNDQFGDFDKVHIPNKPPVIAKMISVLNPEFSSSKLNDVAGKIHQVFSKYKIEPQIIVAIIDTESKFNHELVSSSGDLSMAQVNVEVWNKEFMRMNLDLIEPSKLKVDQVYSLEVMAQILQILKTRYEKKDRRWYARYHSKTKKHKREYLSKLELRLKLLEKSKLLALQ